MIFLLTLKWNWTPTAAQTSRNVWEVWVAMVVDTELHLQNPSATNSKSVENLIQSAKANYRLFFSIVVHLLLLLRPPHSSTTNRTDDDEERETTDLLFYRSSSIFERGPNESFNRDSWSSSNALAARPAKSQSNIITTVLIPSWFSARENVLHATDSNQSLPIMNLKPFKYDNVQSTTDNGRALLPLGWSPAGESYRQLINYVIRSK